MALNIPNLNISLSTAGPSTDLTRFNYTTLHSLAAGQFGKAYLINCNLSDSLYVAKFVDLGILATKDRINCVQEAHILKQLDHPNILKCRETLNPDPSTLILILEYCEGGDLQTCVAKRKEGHYEFRESEIALIMRQLLEGLSYLHDEKKIIHRDIKPANILLTRPDDFTSIKIADFGISKVMDQTLALAHTSIGTPAYMSPEMLRGGGASAGYSYSSDIWALGCVLWELCMMRSVYDSADSIGNLVHLITHRTKRVPKITSLHICLELKSMIHIMLNKVASHRQCPLYYLRRPYFLNPDHNGTTEVLENQDSSEQQQVNLSKLRTMIINFINELGELDTTKGCSIPTYVKRAVSLCRYASSVLKRGGVARVFMGTAIDPRYDVAFEVETIFEDSEDETNQKIHQTWDIRRAILLGEPNIADTEDLCLEEVWDEDWIKRGIEKFQISISDAEVTQIIMLLRDFDQEGLSDEFIVKDLVELFGDGEIETNLKESLMAMCVWKRDVLMKANITIDIFPKVADCVKVISRSAFKSALHGRSSNLSALEVDFIYLLAPKDPNADVYIYQFFDENPYFGDWGHRRSKRSQIQLEISSSNSKENSHRATDQALLNEDSFLNIDTPVSQLRSLGSHSKSQSGSRQVSFSGSDNIWPSVIGCCLKMMQSIWGLVQFLQEQRVSLAEVLIHKRHTKTFLVMFEIYLLRIEDIMVNLRHLSKKIRQSRGAQHVMYHNGKDTPLANVVQQTESVIQDYFDRNVGYLSKLQTSAGVPHYPQKKHLKMLRTFTSVVLNHMFTYIYALIPREEQLQKLNYRNYKGIIEGLRSQIATCCSLAGMLEDNQCALGHYIYILATDYQTQRERKQTVGKLLRDVDMRRTFVKFLDSIDNVPEIMRQTLNNLAESDFELIDLLKHGSDLCSICCAASRTDRPLCVHIKSAISDVAMSVILQMKSLETYIRQKVNRITINISFEVLEMLTSGQNHPSIPSRELTITDSPAMSKRLSSRQRLDSFSRSPQVCSTESRVAAVWSESNSRSETSSYDMSSDTSSGRGVGYILPSRHKVGSRSRASRVDQRSHSAVMHHPRSQRSRNSKPKTVGPNRRSSGGTYLWSSPMTNSNSLN